MSEDDVILVEAESFASRGGWILDTQAIAAMGSAYLNAHGLGVPVANASTPVTFPAAGTYYVYARTRDWVAPHGPGRFQVRINGAALANTLGVGGDGVWRWHFAGVVDLPQGDATVELQDLTGFNARCDALAFTRGPASLPDEGAALEAFRRKALSLGDQPVQAGHFDLVVAGGGYAGVCAAIAAARMGLKVLLVQDRPVLGGNASSEVRVGPIGNLSHAPYPRNGDIVKELQSTPGSAESSGGLRARPNDEHVLSLVKAEANITLLLEHSVVKAEVDDGLLRAIVMLDLARSIERRATSTLFADCTGDAVLGALAGADWCMGREGAEQTGESLAPIRPDNLLLGCTNLWTACHSEAPSSFPTCPWALPISEESRDIATPKYPPDLAKHAYIGGWNWEGGFGRDMIGDVEQIRDHNLRAIFGMWDFLKNRAHDRHRYANARLTWAACLTGKRESRRLIGDLILCEHDILRPVIHPDGCVTATWYFDAHFPHPENTRHFPGQEFRSLAYDDPNFESFRGDIRGEYKKIKPYPIPYRCLYSRNIRNLFMAGRNISTTHVGLLPVRVMNTTAMMGTVIGRAAAVCRRLAALPRDLYARHWDSLASVLGAGGWANRPPSAQA